MPIWLPEAEDYAGEDWSFVQRVKAAGIRTFVDCDLSREIGHSGEYLYTWEDVPLRTEMETNSAKQESETTQLDEDGAVAAGAIGSQELRRQTPASVGGG
jgi:hypothetical protein